MFFLALYNCRQTNLFSSQILFSCSVVSDSATLWTAAHQASLSFTTSQSLLKLMSIELVMPSNHLVLVTVILTSVGKDVAIRIHLCTAGRNVNWYSHYNGMEVRHDKYRTTIQFSNSISGHLSKGGEKN